MKYCSNCGAKVVKRVPSGDNRERFVCDQCDTVHYQNPVIIASCLAHWEDKLVWVKRAEEPRRSRAAATRLELVRLATGVAGVAGNRWCGNFCCHNKLCHAFSVQNYVMKPYRINL